MKSSPLFLSGILATALAGLGGQLVLAADKATASAPRAKLASKATKHKTQVLRLSNLTIEPEGLGLIMDSDFTEPAHPSSFLGQIERPIPWSIPATTTATPWSAPAYVPSARPSPFANPFAGTGGYSPQIQYTPPQYTAPQVAAPRLPAPVQYTPPVIASPKAPVYGSPAASYVERSQDNPYLPKRLPPPPQQVPQAKAVTQFAQPVPSSVPSAPPESAGTSPWNNLGSSLSGLANSLPILPDSGRSILPTVKKVYPTGEKPLVVVSFKCPTELVGVTPPTISLLHSAVDLGLSGLNKTDLLPFNLQQVCQ